METKEYLNGLIKVKEKDKNAFYVYICISNVENLNAILFGKDSRDLYLNALGIK